MIADLLEIVSQWLCGKTTGHRLSNLAIDPPALRLVCASCGYHSPGVEPSPPPKTRWAKFLRFRARFEAERVKREQAA